MTDTTNSPETNELIGRYIAAWNETDPERRRALIARTWTECGSYVDPLAESRGHAGIDAMIEGIRARLPGLRFRLTGAVESHHDRVRLCWELAPEAGTPVAKGTDFGVLADDGRLRCVTGFLDTPSAQ